MNWLKRLFCSHGQLRFVCNLYGDQIIEWGYKRSVWECQQCNALIGKDHLEPAHNIMEKS